MATLAFNASQKSKLRQGGWSDRDIQWLERNYDDWRLIMTRGIVQPSQPAFNSVDEVLPLTEESFPVTPSCRCRNKAGCKCIRQPTFNLAVNCSDDDLPAPEDYLIG